VQALAGFTVSHTGNHTAALHRGLWKAERVTGVLIRDASPGDMPALRDVFRRSSLSNDGDRPNLLAHPEVLELGDRAVREGRTGQRSRTRPSSASPAGSAPGMQSRSRICLSIPGG